MMLGLETNHKWSYAMHVQTGKLVSTPAIDDETGYAELILDFHGNQHGDQQRTYLIPS